MLRRLVFRLALMFAALAAALSGPVQAQEPWPARTIRSVVPFFNWQSPEVFRAGLEADRKFNAELLPEIGVKVR